MDPLFEFSSRSAVIFHSSNYGVAYSAVFAGSEMEGRAVTEAILPWCIAPLLASW